MNESVTLSVKAYNALRDEIAALKNENALYENAFEEMREVDGQRVLVKEKTIYDDIVSTEVWLKCFDDVKKEVEGIFKQRIEDLQEKNKDLQDRYDAMVKKDARDLKTILELKSRNLWQRIRNK